MNRPIVSYYAFGQQADRLIQVELRADGRVRVLRRTNDRGNWTTDKSTDYKAAANAAAPIRFNVAVTDQSYGLIEIGQDQWRDDPYPYAGLHLLNTSLPFGADVEWNAGERKPNASFFPNMVFSFKDGVLSYGDLSARQTWNTTVDLNKTFSSAGQRPRYLVVLRVAPGNNGGVRFENVTDADQLACDV